MNCSILVVDDNALLREVVRSMLEARGFGVVLAKDGPEALKHFGVAPVSAALVDVDMPGLNGVEVCRALRDAASANGHDLPVWLMTGAERPGLDARAQAAGALGVLAKPFTMAELVARIETIFTGKRGAAFAA